MTLEVVLPIAIALCVSSVFGFAITGATLPPSMRHFRWALTPGVGLGFSSIVIFLFRRPIFTVEGALALFSIWYLSRRRNGSAGLSVPVSPSRLTLILCGALGLTAAGLMLRVDRMPHGDWDGWAIWNTHARFLFREGPNWRNGMQYSFHNDYPLLTPALAARFWRYAGQEVPEAGALTGIVLGLSGVAVLGLTLSQLRDPSTGTLLALSLLSTPLYLDHATSQYADIPLSFFILSTLALLCLYAEYADRKILVLAGFTAGCAGWTKNEGMLFIAAAWAVLLLPILRSRSKVIERLLAFSAGLALPLATIIAFKSTILGRNDLIEFQYNTMAKILDASRHGLIAQNFVTVFTSFGHWAVSPLIPLFLFIVFCGVDRSVIRNFGWAAGAAMIAFVVAGYYFVYLISPADLKWHLASSLDRLLLHVWPSLLLLGGMLCRR